MQTQRKGDFSMRWKSLKTRLSRGYEYLGWSGFLKYMEIKLLGKYASPYCYHPPLNVVIEITNRCQLSCKYCYRMNNRMMNPDQGMMSYENFIRAVDQIKGARRLNINGGGEPLLHRDLVKMLTYVNDNSIARSVRIFTNGMLLTPEMADNILAAGVDFIGISLDGSDAESQESLRLGSDFQKIINNAGYVAQKADKKTRIEIISVITSHNIKSIETMPELLNELGIRYFRTYQMMIKTEEGRKISVPRHDMVVESLIDKCAKLDIDYMYYPMPAKTICTDPFQYLFITWDGKITPCFFIETKGLNREPFNFPGFWNGPEMLAWRKDMLTRNYPELCTSICEIIPKNSSR